MKDVVIVSATRTAIGNFGGRLKDISAVELGAAVIKDSLKKIGLRPVATPEQTELAPASLRDQGQIALEKHGYDYDEDLQPIAVDEVIMGNVVGAGLGQNVSRQAMIRAGLAKETPAFTINKVCASGMKALILGTQAIKMGEAEVIMSGGMENMSRIPYCMPTARWGARMGNTEMTDLVVFDGLFEIFYGYHMGITAENIAEKYKISREEQDSLGALSHSLALKAMQAGHFNSEITPIAIPQRKGEAIVFETDERPMETSVEKMAKLRPAFKKDGTVTAGNASGINDGASALLLMSAEKAKQLNLSPLAKIHSYAAGGLDPAYMGLGPVPAVKRILKHQRLTIDDFGTIELNEAFASQAIGCIRELNCKPEKVNTSGSGISLGHPIGCSGARIVTTLAHKMQREDLELGLASLCIGGGQGLAVVLERV